MEKRLLQFFAAIIFTTSLSSVAQGQGPVRFRGFDGPPVSASDVQLIGNAWNVNFQRYQLLWPKNAADTATPAAYDAWLESALVQLDGLLPVYEKAEIKVLVDLQSPPGGNNSSNNTRILQESASQTHFIHVWNKIARRYTGNKTVWGYDLANEPASTNVPSGVVDWHQLATNAAQTIRAVDQTHTIVVEPLLWGKAKGFDSFSPLPASIPNVVYSFHMYYPNEFTHQRVVSPYNGVVKYPGIINKIMWDKAQLRRSMQPAVDFQHKYGVNLLVGEFSAARWAPAASAYTYLKDLIDIFESNGWDWSYHAFREYHGWSVEHTEDINNIKASKKQTSREKLLRYWFGKNAK